MLKELIEDVKRYRADREVNSRLVECYDVGTGKLVRKAWRHVKVCLTIHSTFSAVSLKGWRTEQLCRAFVC